MRMRTKIFSPLAAAALFAPAGCADDSTGPVVPKADSSAAVASPSTPQAPAVKRVGRRKLRASSPTGPGASGVAP